VLTDLDFDEKTSELRRALLANAAATIYVALLSQARTDRHPEPVLDAQLEELRDQAAKAAVDLYFRV
jgi:hypothetical protein